jgi:hypothetical protein
MHNWQGFLTLLPVSAAVGPDVYLTLHGLDLHVPLQDHLRSPQTSPPHMRTTIGIRPMGASHF